MALKLIAAMDCDDALGDIKKLTPFKPGFQHHLFQGFLIGVHTDGFGQIAVTFGVVGDKLAKERQNLERVHIIAFFQQIALHFGKF